MTFIKLLMGEMKESGERLFAIKFFLISIILIYLYDDIVSGLFFNFNVGYFLDTQLPVALGSVLILNKNKNGLFVFGVFFVIHTLYAILHVIKGDIFSFYLFFYSFYPLYATWMIFHYCGKNCLKIAVSSNEYEKVK